MPIHPNTPRWYAEYLTMIEDCEARESRLDDWECQFLDSVKRQLLSNIRMSPKQETRLDEIWEKATAKG